MSPFIAEFFGTFLLILLGTAVVANVILDETKGKGSGWMVITTGWALAVFVGVVVAGPYSGAHINPAVTLAVAMRGELDWVQVPVYMTAQLAGAIIGAAVTWMVYKDHLDRTRDPQIKLAVFSTIPAIRNNYSNFLSEMVGTFVLLFVIFFITGAEMQNEEGSTLPIGLGSVGAIPVAFLVWCIGLCLGGTTGYAINPARDLGPRLFHALIPMQNKGKSDWQYAWIPIFGPFAGAVLAAVLFAIIMP